jgi:heterodisulfide reductase subunit A
MISFTLNGKTVQGKEGEYLLKVAEEHGVEIPTLCHHKALEPAGMCRLCTVEMHYGGRVKHVTACNYPIWEGMEINRYGRDSPDSQAHRGDVACPLPECACHQRPG